MQLLNWVIKMLHAMIIAGGGGTRFWPRSRNTRPKQFLCFHGDRSLLQNTFDRLESQIPADRIWVLTGQRHRDEAIQQLPELPEDNIVGEPMGRDTTACIGLGAALIAKQDPQATILVSPADHVIEPVQEFRRTLQAAEQIVEEHPHALVTFGIPPTFPSTGYGYIHRGPLLTHRQGIAVYRVQQFKEKPKAETAEQFLVSGEYFWNSGIFIWKAKTILQELKRLEPEIYKTLEVIAENWDTPQRMPIFTSEYSEKLKKISIDFAVMEKAKEVLVLQAPYQWDDVGSWLALERRLPQDVHGNTIQGLHSGIKTQQCVIVSDGNHLITTIGIEDLLIIQDGNCLLIANRKEEETVKHLVDQLKKQQLEKYL